MTAKTRLSNIDHMNQNRNDNIMVKIIIYGNNNDENNNVVVLIVIITAIMIMTTKIILSKDNNNTMNPAVFSTLYIEIKCKC